MGYNKDTNESYRQDYDGSNRLLGTPSEGLLMTGIILDSETRTQGSPEQLTSGEKKFRQITNLIDELKKALDNTGATFHFPRVFSSQTDMTAAISMLTDAQHRLIPTITSIKKLETLIDTDYQPDLIAKQNNELSDELRDLITQLVFRVNKFANRVDSVKFDTQKWLRIVKQRSLLPILNAAEEKSLADHSAKNKRETDALYESFIKEPLPISRLKQLLGDALNPRISVPVMGAVLPIGKGLDITPNQVDIQSAVSVAAKEVCPDPVLNQQFLQALETAAKFLGSEQEFDNLENACDSLEALFAREGLTANREMPASPEKSGPVTYEIPEIVLTNDELLGMAEGNIEDPEASGQYVLEYELEVLANGGVGGLPPYIEGTAFAKKVQDLYSFMIAFIDNANVGKHSIHVSIDTTGGSPEAAVAWKNNSDTQIANLPPGTMVSLDAQGGTHLLTPQTGLNVEVHVEMVHAEELLAGAPEFANQINTKGVTLVQVGPSGEVIAIITQDQVITLVRQVAVAKAGGDPVPVTPEPGGNQAPIGTIDQNQGANIVSADQLSTVRERINIDRELLVNSSENFIYIILDGKEYILVEMANGQLGFVETAAVTRQVASGEEGNNPATEAQAGYSEALSVMPETLKADVEANIGTQAEVQAGTKRYYFDSARMGIVDNQGRVWRPNMAANEAAVEAGWLSEGENSRVVVTVEHNGQQYTLTYVIEFNKTQMAAHRSEGAPSFSDVSIVGTGFEEKLTSWLQGLTDAQFRNIFGDKTEATIFHTLVANVDPNFRSAENFEVVDPYLFRADNKIGDAYNVDKLPNPNQAFVARTYSNWGSDVALGTSVEIVNALGTIAGGQINAMASNSVNSRERTATFNHFFTDQANPTPVVVIN